MEVSRGEKSRVAFEKLIGTRLEAAYVSVANGKHRVAYRRVVFCGSGYRVKIALFPHQCVRGWLTIISCTLASVHHVRTSAAKLQNFRFTPFYRAVVRRHLAFNWHFRIKACVIHFRRCCETRRKRPVEKFSQRWRNCGIRLRYFASSFNSVQLDSNLDLNAIQSSTLLLDF